MDSGQSHSRVNRLTKRSQYLAVRHGVKRYGKYFLLEVLERRDLSDSFDKDKTVKPDKKKKSDKKVEMDKIIELKKGMDRKDGLQPRIGFTVTRRQGNAVKRNRIRRRLKEAIRLEAYKVMKPGHDYVLVGYKEILSARFSDIIDSLETRFNSVKTSDKTSVANPSIVNPSVANPSVANQCKHKNRDGV